jgi:hypothetical protein
VLPPRAAEGDGKGCFPLLFIQGYEESHQLKEALSKHTTLFGVLDIVHDTFVMAVIVSALIDEIGIGQETDIEDNVRIGRKAITIPERRYPDNQSLARRKLAEIM